jgi:hypothetical protein
VRVGVPRGGRLAGDRDSAPQVLPEKVEPGALVGADAKVEGEGTVWAPRGTVENCGDRERVLLVPAGLRVPRRATSDNQSKSRLRAGRLASVTRTRTAMTSERCEEHATWTSPFACPERLHFRVF